MTKAERSEVVEVEVFRSSVANNATGRSNGYVFFVRFADGRLTPYGYASVNSPWWPDQDVEAMLCDTIEQAAAVARAKYPSARITFKAE